ncbi:MAG: helix-turn-helix domain-containing protein [Planctomycetaceae bacterium]|nr:helix-turn-helix domain-containing protein [Planctomycetaceae bacterium]
MTKISEYVKVAEAAQILGVSQNTVRAWAENGNLPAHRNPANGYRLFRRTDLERFLKTISTKRTHPGK